MSAILNSRLSKDQKMGRLIQRTTCQNKLKSKESLIIISLCSLSKKNNKKQLLTIKRR